MGINSLNKVTSSHPGAFKRDLSKFGHVILQCYDRSFYSGTVLPTNSYITLEWPVQGCTLDYWPPIALLPKTAAEIEANT